MQPRLFILGVSLVASMVMNLLILESFLIATGYQRYKHAWSFVTRAESDTKTTGYYAPDKKKIYAPNKQVWFNTDSATDKFGYRLTRRARPRKEKRSLTIVAVGDSFTYGHGVSPQDAYPSILEELFGRPQNGLNDVVVYNAGVPGYGPDQEFIYIQEIIDNQSPDLIIWNFNANDAGDSHEACLFLEFYNRLTQLPGWLNTLYLQGYLVQHLPTPLLNHNTTDLLLYFPNRVFNMGRMTLGCTGVLSEEGILKKIRRLVDTMYDYTRERGVDMVVTLVPFQWYFDKSIRNDHWAIVSYTQLRNTLASLRSHFIDINMSVASLYDPELVLTRSTTDSSTLSRGVLGLSTENPAVTLFRNEEEQQFAYGWRHPNALGYRLIAEAVYNDLFSYLTSQQR